MMNFGSQNESNIQCVLNKKRYPLLSNHWKSMFKIMFGTQTLILLNRIKRIKCVKTENYIKPDIIVTFGGLDRYISIKSGKASNVHTEKMDTFIPFLRSLFLRSEN